MKARLRFFKLRCLRETIHARCHAKRRRKSFGSLRNFLNDSSRVLSINEQFRCAFRVGREVLLVTRFEQRSIVGRVTLLSVWVKAYMTSSPLSRSKIRLFSFGHCARPRRLTLQNATVQKLVRRVFPPRSILLAMAHQSSPSRVARRRCSSRAARAKYLAPSTPAARRTTVARWKSAARAPSRFLEPRRRA